jgi:hypothetical protein
VHQLATVAFVVLNGAEGSALPAEDLSVSVRMFIKYVSIHESVLPCFN